MSTPNKTAPDFGEPWKTANYRDGGIVTSYDQPIMEGFKLVKRAVACVNACRGMADPAKEIEQLRRERDEALSKLSTVYCWIERNHPDGFIDSQSHVQNLDRVADAWHDKLEAMREAIKEAHSTLRQIHNHGRGAEVFPAQPDDHPDCSWCVNFHNTETALAKLQPFLKP